MARVPRRIKDNNTIGSDQIDSKTSGSSGNEKQHDVGVGVELIHQFFAFHSIGASIQTEVWTIFGPPFVRLTYF